jgi:hypothetical protein
MIEMHYTVGASVTACLNIALLIPLANNPLLDNYIMVLYANQIFCLSLDIYVRREVSLPMRLYLGCGGVRALVVLHNHR